MKVKQVATLLNTVYNEIIGETALVKEDLSNIVDVGREIISSTQWGDNFDKFVGKLIDQVGRVIFVDRTYKPDDLGLLRDSWTYGSILQKVRCDVGDYVDNKAWQLADTQKPDFSDLFDFDSAPTVMAKYFNMKTTFREKICITREQAESAFRSAEDMNRFISMIENRIQMKMNLATEALAYRTEANLIAEKLWSGNNVVNLLHEYHTETSDDSVTAGNWKTKPDFLRFVSNKLQMYKKLIAKASTLFNDAGYTTFTPPEKLRMYALTDFASAMRTHLYGNTYHTEFVEVDGYHEVPYWQGMGTSALYDDRSMLNVIPASQAGNDSAHIVQDGIIFVMQDDEAALICCEQNPVDSLYNPEGRFYKYFYSADASYYNDLAENVIVFTVSEYYYVPMTVQPADWSTDYSNYYVLTNGKYVKNPSNTFSADTRYYKKA